MKGRTWLLVIGLVLALPMVASAQLPTASKYENVTWYNEVHIAFKGGERNAALSMIREHFIPTVEEAGIERPRLLEHTTGPWDITVIWHLEEGPGQLEWEVSPWAEAWWTTFSEREGGPEAAGAMFAEYQAKIAKSTSSIVIERN